MFDDVPLFVATVEAGGFAAAARRLNLSRSVVGKAVARLERRLDTRLLQRTTRRVVLTDDGLVFFEHCRRAIAELEAAHAVLDGGRARLGGVLSASMPVLYGRARVAPVLIRLAASHPTLALRLDFRDGLVDLVADRFDLAIRMGPLADTAALMSVRIGEEHTTVYAAPSYLERHGVPDGPGALAGHATITYSRDGRVQPWIVRATDGGTQTVTPPSRFRFDDLGAIADAAIAGIGLAFLPDWLIGDALRRDRLRPVLPDLPPVSSPVHAVWPVTDHLPRRVRAALDALKTPPAGAPEPEP